MHYPFLWGKHLYKVELNKRVNFSNPKDLNDKIQWLEFFTDTSKWSVMADKYAVRQYVTSKTGEGVLIPLLGMWRNVEEIDFNSLPDRFVIKPNNGSYDTIIVTDKSKADIEDIKRRLDKSLHSRFGLDNAEPHYLRIKPCIIAEELLETDSPYGLVDYKIWCFNGQAHSLFVCFNRDSVTHHADFMAYDLDWQRHPEMMNEDNNCECPKPENLDAMIKIAEKLAEGLPQCRVDLYNIDGKIYFGEMTLTSNYGMMPYYTQNTLDEMGSLCKLPTPGVQEYVKCLFKRYMPII